MNDSSTLISSMILVVHILFCLIFPIIAQPNFISRVCQDTFGNYTANSKFKENLDQLLGAITSNTQVDYGFYNMSVGDDMERVNGIGLCRPDISVSDCQLCLKQASLEIVKQCPNQKDAIGWYELCMIRYSDRYIFRKMEIGPWYHLESPFFGIDGEKFNQTAAALLSKLQREASNSSDSRYKFAAEQANVTNSRSIYALVQCTPDLEDYDCYNCLDQAIPLALNLSHAQARIVFTSCNVRYEAFAFYNATSLTALQSRLQHSSWQPLSPSFTANPKRSGAKKSRVMILLLVLSISSAILVILFVYWGSRSAKRIKALKTVQKIGEELRTPESLQMNLVDVKAATNNFSDVNKLGKGGFGTVYKGRLPNGQDIAVKRLTRHSGQGDDEFKNEALLVARLQHRNLVRFLGFCLEGEERLLIYELLPNKSLDCFLFDPIKRLDLDWPSRYNIIQGIARGLVYLHEDSRLLVVHRDLKAGNILLDAEMNPKIADFGLAKLFEANNTHDNASKICGTYGYMPPEYLQQGKFSTKSDVFSFGVLLLEIISGLRVTSFSNSEVGDNLLKFVWKNWLEGTALTVVDSAMSSFNPAEVMGCINIGLLCVQDNIAYRPTMSSVVLMLNGDANTLPVPSRPAFLLYNELHGEGSTSSSAKAADYSKNYISVSEFDPR